MVDVLLKTKWSNSENHRLEALKSLKEKQNRKHDEPPYPHHTSLVQTYIEPVRPERIIVIITKYGKSTTRVTSFV